MIAGGVVSITVTLVVQEVEFPEPSVAEHDAPVVPSWKVEPEGGAQLIPVIPGQLSEACGPKETVAPPGPVHSIVWGAGQVMDGA